MSDQPVLQGANPEINLENLFESIRAELAAKYPDFVTVEFFRGMAEGDRDELQIPAMLLELDSMEVMPDEDPGTDQTATKLTFSLMVILTGVRNPRVRFKIASLMASLVNFIDKRRWLDASKGDGTKVYTDPAAVSVAEKDQFEPGLDRYEVWRIEWDQLCYLGQSVWEGGEFLPDRIFWSHTPIIGLAHKDEYVEGDITQ